jgi:hypothetical protein
VARNVLAMRRGRFGFASQLMQRLLEAAKGHSRTYSRSAVDRGEGEVVHRLAQRRVPDSGARPEQIRVRAHRPKAPEVESRFVEIRLLRKGKGVRRDSLAHHRQLLADHCEAEVDGRVAGRLQLRRQGGSAREERLCLAQATAPQEGERRGVQRGGHGGHGVVGYGGRRCWDDGGED